VLNTIGYVPIVNDEIEINGNKFRVEKMSGRGVAMVSFLASPKIIINIQDRYM
jgi:Mg2+/Co2+ transporter CorC